MEEAKAGGIHKKLAVIMAEVEKIPKNGYNEFHRYKYATESDVSEHIRPLLSAQGLSVCFNVEQVERIQVREPVGNKDYPGDITRVKVKIVIGDESGETMESLVYGEGQDKGDKGIYKAYTGAVKYWLFKTFLISTGDDPEQHPAPAKQQQPVPTKPFTPQQQPVARQEPPKAQTTEPKLMSDPQKKKLFAMMNTKQMSREQAKKLFDKIAPKSASDASAFIENFETHYADFMEEEQLNGPE